MAAVGGEAASAAAPRTSGGRRRWALSAARLGLGAAALLYLLVWLACGLAIALGAVRAGWPSLLRELAFFLFLPLPALLVLGLLLRARATLLLLAPVLLLFVTAYGPRLAPTRAAGADTADLTVLTFNAGGNAGGGRAAPLLRTILAADADIVALQEVPATARPTVREELQATYPYSTSARDDSDMIVYSRYPLRGAQGLPLARAGYAGHQVTVDVGGRPVTLINVHLSRPGYRLNWRGGLVPTIRAFDPASRDVQVAELRDYLRTLDGPRLLVGDFNATDWSHSHALLTADLQDSFAEAGRGLGHTYPSNIAWGAMRVALPLIRIDYVFHSRELIALAAAVGPDGGSDHLPVIARFAFR